MRRATSILIFLFICLVSFSAFAAGKNPPKQDARTKFYNFDDMLIDGEIKKPTALYTDVRQRARFDRLLKLKKSFLGPLFDTARERVFR